LRISFVSGEKSGHFYPPIVQTNRKIEANFAGGQVSSDGGVMLLRQVDRWLGFTKQWEKDSARATKPALNASSFLI
jgi:Transposase DDE domain group 1